MIGICVTEFFSANKIRSTRKHDIFCDYKREKNKIIQIFFFKKKKGLRKTRKVYFKLTLMETPVMYHFRLTVSCVWRTHKRTHKDIKRGSMPYGGQFEFTFRITVTLHRHLFILLLPYSLRNAYDETREENKQTKRKKNWASRFERPLLGNHALLSRVYIYIYI